MRNRPDCSISLCICKRSLSRLHHSNRLTKASAISFSCLGKLAQAAVRTSGPFCDGASQVRRFFHDDAHRTLGSAASPPELGDRNLAPTHSLAHLEALELRMVDVERLVPARILVGGA